MLKSDVRQEKAAKGLIVTFVIFLLIYSVLVIGETIAISSDSAEETIDKEFEGAGYFLMFYSADKTRAVAFSETTGEIVVVKSGIFGWRLSSKSSRINSTMAVDYDASQELWFGWAEEGIKSITINGTYNARIVQLDNGDRYWYLFDVDHAFDEGSEIQLEYFDSRGEKVDEFTYENV